LLRILAKRLIVYQLGEIVGYELNKPFAYLHRIARGNTPGEIVSGGSEQVRLGAQTPRAPFERRSSASNTSSEWFKSSWNPDPKLSLSAFLSGLRFEKRNLLDELPHVLDI
jgi:hypothetical protein